MRIYYSNIITDATLTASSTQLGSEIISVTQPQLGSTFTFDANNGSIVMDFGTATNIKSFVIDMGNLTSGATMTLQASATDSWGIPDWATALTKTDTMAYADIDETYRYYRILLYEATVSKLEIGYIQIGPSPYLQMPGIILGSELHFNTTSQKEESISLQVYSDIGFQYLSTVFTFPQIHESTIQINGVDVATRKEVITMWDELQNIIPGWFLLWESNLDEYAPVFAVIDTNDLIFKKSTYGKYYEMQLPLKGVR